MKKYLSFIIIISMLVINIQAFENSVSAAESAEGYNDSYGSQLSTSDYSRQIYDNMVAKFVYQDGDEGNPNGIYTGLAKSVTEGDTVIKMPLSGIECTVPSNNSDEISEMLTDLAASKVSPAVTAAFDAFTKDYPEVYWMNSIEYSISASIYTNSSTGSTDVEINQVTITAREYCDGLIEKIPEFNQSVIRTINNMITNNNIDTNTSDADIAKYIHDYLSDCLSYNWDAAVTGPTGKNIYSFTPVPVFLDVPLEGKAVCEGYAKAFAILGNRMGLENAIIVGQSTNIGGVVESHMWNAVRLEDERWYAVDVTWDDQVAGTYYNYFLAGMDSKGFYLIYREDHKGLTTFSDYTYSKNFAIPEIASKGYGYVIEGSEGQIYDGYSEQITTTIAKEETVKGSQTLSSISRQENTTADTGASKSETDTKSVTADSAADGKQTASDENKSKISVSKMKVSKMKKTYRLQKGKAVKPKVTLKYKGKKLKKGKDYTITYKNNKKKGTGKIIIQGKGKYQGRKVIKFKIK